jgi:hypothetical protein
MIVSICVTFWIIFLNTEVSSSATRDSKNQRQASDEQFEENHTPSFSNFRKFEFKKEEFDPSLFDSSKQSARFAPVRHRFYPVVGSIQAGNALLRHLWHPKNARMIQSVAVDYFNEDLSFSAYELLTVSLNQSSTVLYQLSVLTLNVSSTFQSSEKNFMDRLNKLKGQVDSLRKGDINNEESLRQLSSHDFQVRTSPSKPTVSIRKGVVLVNYTASQNPTISTFSGKETLIMTRLFEQLDDSLSKNLNKTLVQVILLMRELPVETMAALQDVCSTIQREFITFNFTKVARPNDPTQSGPSVQGGNSARLLQSQNINWDLNFTVFQKVVCPSVRTLNSTLATEVINVYLSNGRFTESFNQLLNIRTNGTGVITKVNNQNAIFKVNDFELPLQSYTPSRVQLNLTDLSTPQRFITTSQVISKGNSVIFELPPFISQVSMIEDDNCLFPILLAGYDLIPTISIPTQDKSLVIIKASLMGFANTHFPENQPITFPIQSSGVLDPPELRLKLFNQTLVLNSSFVGVRIVCLASCLYFRNRSQANATVNFQFLNPQIKQPQIIRKTDEIQNFRISPNDYELAWFNKSDVNRIIYWNTTQSADLTLIFDYASIIHSKRPDASFQLAQNNPEPDLVRQIFTAQNGVTSFDFPSEKEGRLRIINNGNQVPLQVSIITLPKSPPTRAYIYIIIGVVLGVILLIVIAIVSVLIVKRYLEREKTKRMFPIMTNDIMMNSDSEYKQISDFVNQNKRDSYNNTNFTSDKSSKTPEVTDTNSTPDVFFQVTMNDLIFKNQSVVLNNATQTGKRI